MVETIEERVKRIVFEKFYPGPVSGSCERLTKALIEEFGLKDEEKLASK